MNPVIALDLGDFVGRRNPAYGYDTNILIECLGRMEYDLVAIGEKEVSWGLDLLERDLAAHNLTPVCANILVAETEKPRFREYVIVKAGNAKVGITSIIGGKSVVPRTLKEREGVLVKNPVLRSQEVLKELKKKKVDLTVLIVHGGMEKAEEIASLMLEEGDAPLSGYDVVLVGHGRAALEEPKKIAGSILMAGGSRSDKIGELTVIVQNKQVLNFEGRSISMKQNEGPFDPYIREITWDAMELDEDGKRVRKAKTGPDDKAKKEKQENRQSAADSKKGSGSFDKYLGVDRCRLCHEDVYAQWLGTAHASAFKTIANDEKWDQPECWSCHVTGFGERTGHSEKELMPERWNVQCEVCHGMGTFHTRSPDRPRVDEKTCARCHVKEHSPDFDFDKYLPQIMCSTSG